MILFLTMFVNSMMHTTNISYIEDVKQNLNLSAKAIAQNVYMIYDNVAEVGSGYNFKAIKDIEVNKENLLRDFDQVLKNHYTDQEKYQKARNNIPVKILVLHDRFYAAGWENEWSEPYFFYYRDGNRTYFLNTVTTDAYYFDSNGMEQWTTIDPKIRDEVVISRVNAVVGAYTSAYFSSVGAELSGDSVLRHTNNQLSISIQNPSQIDLTNLDSLSSSEISTFFHERYKQSNFNVLDGITFFVVYLEEKYFASRAEEIIYTNYNVTGYTIDTERKIEN